MAPRKKEQRFLDALGAEVVRISETTFGWSPRDLHRCSEIIRGGEVEPVRASALVVLQDADPEKCRVILRGTGGSRCRGASG